ncbi:MAG: gamma-glutamylcyclotransferase family protein [Kiloniellaceae bacterium]
MRFFFFGLLADSDMLELVIGRPAPGRPFPRARLAGFRLARLRGESFPVLAPAPGSRVEGVVVGGLSAADVDRILFFESVEYEPAPVAVELLDGGIVEAQAFTASARGDAADEEWRFEDWLARHKARDLRETALWMTLYGRLDVAAADRLWDRARAEGRPLEDLIREIRRAPLRTGS